jgi:hypothetical protein
LELVDFPSSRSGRQHAQNAMKNVDYHRQDVAARIDLEATYGKGFNLVSCKKLVEQPSDA